MDRIKQGSSDFRPKSLFVARDEIWWGWRSSATLGTSEQEIFWLCLGQRGRDGRATVWKYWDLRFIVNRTADSRKKKIKWEIVVWWIEKRKIMTDLFGEILKEWAIWRQRMTSSKWKIPLGGIELQRNLKPWVKEGLVILTLLTIYGLMKAWFLVTFPHTRLGGAMWIRDLQWIFSKPVCLFYAMLITADGVGGFGIISILIVACFVRVKYFWKWMTITGISITVISITLQLFPKTGRTGSVLLAIIYTAALIFFFALPIYWYRGLYKEELARRKGWTSLSSMLLKHHLHTCHTMEHQKRSDRLKRTVTLLERDGSKWKSTTNGCWF